MGPCGPCIRYAGLVASLGTPIALGLLVALIAGWPAAARADTAESELPASVWIERANEALLPGDSMIARVRLFTRDGHGGEWLDELDMVRVSDEDGETRTLLEVEAPEEGEGTAYEVRARPDGTLERWVWLAELRRLRRLTGVRRTDPFLGTEFTYEDLGLAIPVERARGSVRVVGEGADRRVEVTSPAYHYYDRVVTRIDPSTELPERVLFYDRAGQLFREERFEGIRSVDGHPFPTTITVRDHITGAFSVLRFESVRFDVDVPDVRFTDSVIRRRLAARGELVPDDATTGGEGGD